MVTPQGGYGLQGLLDGDTVAECHLGGMLNDRPIGERIGKAHTDLEDIGAVLGQRFKHINGGGQVRIAHWEIGDE
jgi:hypothetical protein